MDVRSRYRLAIFVLPLYVLLTAAFLAQFALGQVQSGLWRSIFSALWAALISVGLWWILKKLFQKGELQSPFWGGVRSLILGLGAGLVISLICGWVLGIYLNVNIHYRLFGPRIYLQILSSLFPALTEEIVFRAGVVEATRQLFGFSFALLAGSVPFGVFHLLGLVIGQSVDLGQVIGISLAGLMLSLFYLRFGLTAAVGCHLAWNSLSATWARALNMEVKAGITIFEGAWTTSLVLAVVCLILYFYPRLQNYRVRS